MDYKGIEIADTVKLYKADGDYNQTVKDSLDKFIKSLEESNHTLIGKYNGASKNTIFRCDLNHEYEVTPSRFTKHNRLCPVCRELGVFKKLSQEDLERVKIVTAVEVDINRYYEFHGLAAYIIVALFVMKLILETKLE
ncbi:hypothetical protein HFZ78_19280 [Priestia megaterium]|uniref:Uncharacterized protein n=1 Tax=Priestia megaterium TaxID=1404 RepID=A0A6H1P4V2_PRIMG|nr:hypothetical protein [Priestia megaterium]QIZ08589.1 hypothetical protein HFZ78_19280 [Priestia megaterium]